MAWVINYSKTVTLALPHTPASTIHERTSEVSTVLTESSAARGPTICWLACSSHIRNQAKPHVKVMKVKLDHSSMLQCAEGHWAEVERKPWWRISCFSFFLNLILYIMKTTQSCWTLSAMGEYGKLYSTNCMGLFVLINLKVKSKNLIFFFFFSTASPCLTCNPTASDRKAGRMERL